ncbi:MAG: nitronate monooxygenase [Bacteroidota bacterium]|nr:nitronate monooxygenase [Bacteroidota bacterium]
MRSNLDDMLGVKYPIIMAPMFLVTNTKMMIEALNNGIAACIPALNFRTDLEFRNALEKIRNETDSTALGVNLIVNKSNIKLNEQLKSCVELKVNFIITSLGNPKFVIEKCKKNNIKVFCDVIDKDYAKKVENLGADGIIAVNNKAGGHAGNYHPNELIPMLRNHCNIPVISAGGIGDKSGVEEMLDLGAAGVSIGSPFIACLEADITNEYKEACVKYGKSDIILTTKLTGTPCTVINTDYVKHIGTKQNWIEKLLTKNKKLKKWIKTIKFIRSMKVVKTAAFNTTYKTVWCAGPSIEYTKQILPVKDIIRRLVL